MRKNLLNPIHKALRAICYDTAQHLQQTNFQDREESAAAMTNLRRTLSLLDLHIAHETDFIHPLIKNFNIDLQRHLREMHGESMEFAAKVRAEIDALHHCINAEEKTKKGTAVFEAFETLMVFNLILFIKEEKVLNEMLWTTCSDDKLRTVEQEMIISMPADVLEFETLWMMRSLNNLEISQWLEGVRYSAPDFVFESLVQLAENELPARRFEKLLTLLEPVAEHAY